MSKSAPTSNTCISAKRVAHTCIYKCKLPCQILCKNNLENSYPFFAKFDQTLKLEGTISLLGFVWMGSGKVRGLKIVGGWKSGKMENI